MESMENCKQHKRDYSQMQRKDNDKVYNEDEITTLELLEIMQMNKDLHKWHENLVCNKRCKEFVEGPSSSSSASASSTITIDEDDKNAESLVSLVINYEEERHRSLIENSSDLPPLESLRDCVLECGKPLKKQLQKSDVNTHNNRLLLNKKHVETIFLPMLKNDENIKTGIQVCVYDMHDNVYPMTFKIWADKYYILTTKWNSFFKFHKLQTQDFVTVWMFRHSISNRLCFALAYQKNCSQMQRKDIDKVFSEDEITTLELLDIMQMDKDLHKWHENLVCNKRCKEFVEGSSSALSTTTMDEDDKITESLVSLVSKYKEERHRSLIQNRSDLPPLESLRDYILECGKPLEKQLQKSDVNTNNNRLLLNKKHVETIFLPLLKNDENIKTGIQVCVYDMHDHVYPMTFKIWADKYYILTTNWNNFFKFHKLQTQDFVTVWMFRHSISNRLCFALAYQKNSQES
ncbi:putative B3 domain-containing protein, partial [Mucuna pruriens]